MTATDAARRELARRELIRRRVFRDGDMEFLEGLKPWPEWLRASVIDKLKEAAQ